MPVATTDRLAVAIVVGTTRPGRRAHDVARWVLEHAERRGDADYAILDLAAFDLPVLDEAAPAMKGGYAQPHTRAWADAVARYDAFAFVTPEYNHSVPPALKNALDYLYAEWNDKAAGFVSYGADAGGTRAVEHLRLIAAELRLAGVRTQVALSLFDDFEHFTAPAPRDGAHDKLGEMLDQLLAWGAALRTVRQPVAA